MIQEPDSLRDLVTEWPVDTAAVGVSDALNTLGLAGDPHWVHRVASVTKLFVAYAGLVAIEEGTIDLDTEVGPPGATARHLLAHTSGYPFDGAKVQAAPGGRRIYSNTGIEVFGAWLSARSAMAVADYVAAAVFEPLGMTRTVLAGSPAHGATSCVADLLAFGRELIAPTLVSAATLEEATRAQFPTVAGVVPGWGRFDPCPWGLGFELKGEKSPHWTGDRMSNASFGHFGGSGAFLWVDPIARLTGCAVTDRDFGEWALAPWPAFNDELLYRYALTN